MLGRDGGFAQLGDDGAVRLQLVGAVRIAQADGTQLLTELQQLGDLTYQDAKAEGFRTRDDFYAYWKQGRAYPGGDY